VDPAKAFYGGLDWRLDADFPSDNVVRIVQITRRLPGRVDAADTSYTSVRDLADAMRRVHGGRAGRRRAADLSVKAIGPDQRA
jgi:hypothetical protein